jgi:hypothetical protein
VSDKIVSKPGNDAYREGWERAFGLSDEEKKRRERWLEAILFAGCDVPDLLDGTTHRGRFRSGWDRAFGGKERQNAE